MEKVDCFWFRVRASILQNCETSAAYPSDGDTVGGGMTSIMITDLTTSVLVSRPAIFFVILAIAAALASPAFAQTSTPIPRAVTIVSGDSLPYLRVDDCISHLPCRQLGREQSVTVNDKFMFFSILSTGIDVKVHHRILLKIAGFAIPDTIGTLVREDARTQRIYFLVDIHRFERVPAANSGNIDVSVDGKMITWHGDR